MNFFYALPFLICGVFAGDVLQDWNDWKSHHGREYESEREDRFRLGIFLENSYKIKAHNALAENGEKSYFMAMNEYGDIRHEEFVKVMNGFSKDAAEGTNNATRYVAKSTDELPTEVNWVKEGAVTSVKNQLQCGSCWAFSSTGALEGQAFLKKQSLPSLSEQNLVDCSKSYGNSGCGGGLMTAAFTYIKVNGGIDTELSYPYTASEGNCKYNPNTKGATDIGYIEIQKDSEPSLQAACAKVGPISVAIDASHSSFQFYQKGVYSEKDCTGANLDHGVLVVGYGQEPTTGRMYWLVKNSWGNTWGLGGYFKLARNEDNMCGVASMASYPLVNSHT